MFHPFWPIHPKFATQRWPLRVGSSAKRIGETPHLRLRDPNADFTFVHVPMPNEGGLARVLEVDGSRGSSSLRRLQVELGT